MSSHRTTRPRYTPLFQTLHLPAKIGRLCTGMLLLASAGLLSDCSSGGGGGGGGGGGDGTPAPTSWTLTLTNNTTAALTGTVDEDNRDFSVGTVYSVAPEAPEGGSYDANTGELEIPGNGGVFTATLLCGQTFTVTGFGEGPEFEETGSCGATSVTFSPASPAPAPTSWALTLTKEAGTALTLTTTAFASVAKPASAPGVVNGSSGSITMDADSTSATVTLRCADHATFQITGGAQGYPLTASSRPAGTDTECDEAPAVAGPTGLAPPTWQVALAKAASVSALTLTTNGYHTVAGTNVSGDSPNISMEEAAESATVTLLCSIHEYFIITGGAQNWNDAGNTDTGMMSTVQEPATNCGGGTPAPSAVRGGPIPDLTPEVWQVKLTNDTGIVDLSITLDADTNTAVTGVSGGATYANGATVRIITFGGGVGENAATATLLCTAATFVIENGAPSSVATQNSPGTNGSDCGKQGESAVAAAIPAANWAVTLTFDSTVELVLTTSAYVHTTEVAVTTGSGDVDEIDSTHFTVPATADGLTVTVPCTQATFEITAGADIPSGGELSAARGNAADCVEGTASTSIATTLERPHWVVTVENTSGAERMLTYTNSNVYEVSGDGVSVPANQLSPITIPNTNTATIKIACSDGNDTFALTAITDVTIASDTPADEPSTCGTSAEAAITAAVTLQSAVGMIWFVTLTKEAGTAIELILANDFESVAPTSGTGTVTDSSSGGAHTIRMDADSTGATVTLLCADHAAFQITDGAQGYPLVQLDRMGTGEDCNGTTQVLSTTLTPPAWEVTLTKEANVALGGSLETNGYHGVAGTQVSGVSPSITMQPAAESATVTLLCSTQEYFVITGGAQNWNDAGNTDTGMMSTVQEPATNCGGGTPAPSEVIGGPIPTLTPEVWVVNVTNSSGVDDLPVTLAANIRADAFVTGGVAGDLYLPTSGIFTLGITGGEELAAVALLCSNTNTFTFANGAPATLTATHPGASCGSEATAAAPVAIPAATWTVGLTFDSAIALTLTTTAYDNSAGITSVGTGTVTATDSTHFTVPETITGATVTVPCTEETFEITAGADIPPGGLSAARGSAADCIAAATATPVTVAITPALERRHWVVTVRNTSGAQQMLTYTNSNVFEVSGDGVSVPTNQLSPITIPNTNTATIKIACSDGSDTFAIADITNVLISQATTNKPDTCGTSAEAAIIAAVVLQDDDATLWTVTLSHGEVYSVPIKLDAATLAAISGHAVAGVSGAIVTPIDHDGDTGSVYVVPGHATDANRRSLAFTLTCTSADLNFGIVTAAGTSPVRGETLATKSDCATAGSASLTVRKWAARLANSSAAALRLKVDSSPTSSTLRAALAVNTLDYNAATQEFDLEANRVSPQLLPCHVAFIFEPNAIFAGASLSPPSNCVGRSSTPGNDLILRDHVLFWTVKVTNTGGVPIPDLGFVPAPGNTFENVYSRTDTQLRGDLTGTSEAEIKILCSVPSFTISGEFIGNPYVVHRPFPPLAPGGTLNAQTCGEDSGGSVIANRNLVAIPPPAFTLNEDTPVDLPADGSRLFTFNATAGQRMFISTRGANNDATNAISLTVAGPGTFSVTDNNRGLGKNAALAFTVDAAQVGEHTITLLNSGTGSANLTLNARVVAPATDVWAISRGSSVSCFLFATGRASCAGNSGDVRLLGSSAAAAGDRVAFMYPIGGDSAKMHAISIGAQHACAIVDVGGNSFAQPAVTTDDEAVCWGSDASHALGDLAAGTRADPVSVEPESNTNISGVTAISSGDKFACAIAGGAAVCWGEGGYGQLGRATSGDRRRAAGVVGLGSGVTEIAASRTHACAIVAGSAVKCWGNQFEGRLGNGQTGSLAVNTAADVMWGETGDDDATKVALTATGLSSSASSATCAISTTGPAVCWGRAGNGILGNGANTNSGYAVRVSGLGTGVSAISVGLSLACAIHDEDTSSSTNPLKVKCWGEHNTQGRLGTGIAPGAGINHNTPQDVLATNLALGDTPSLSDGYGGRGMCVIATSGAAHCWGQGLDGILGEGGNSAAEPAPVPVYDTRTFLTTP